MLAPPQVIDLLIKNKHRFFGEIPATSYTGSHAFGLATENTTDIDLMGVFVPPVEHYLGVFSPKESTIEIKEPPIDGVFYDIRKMVYLLTKGNPTVLSFLWVRPEDVVLEDFVYASLTQNRELFVGKHAYYSFAGYAKQQLQKLKSSEKLVTGKLGEKRKALVEEFGFDPKSASHLIRLLKMCIEFLNSGNLCVYRTVDREQLLEIKQGKWKIEEILEYANALDADAKTAFVKSSLPETPNEKKINELLIDILENSYGYD